MRITHKDRGEMWKGGYVSIKAAEGMIDKGLRVMLGGGDAMKRL
jgi:hypothetical protein